MNEQTCEERNTMTELAQFLRKLPKGGIRDEDTVSAINHLLSRCWDQLRGSSDKKMTADKLDRMERVEWDPPLLSFVIERHGAVCVGSSRAELQGWAVDIQAQTATPYSAGHRQQYPMSPRLNVVPIAEDLVNCIVNGADDDRLKWNVDKTRATVRIGPIIGRGFKQTVAGRRRRLGAALRERLEKVGWSLVERTTPHTYERSSRTC